MKQRTKLWLGMGLLGMIMMLAVAAGLLLFSSKPLTESGGSVLANNYRSLNYMHQINLLLHPAEPVSRNTDQPLPPPVPPGCNSEALLKWATLQRQNITEPVEAGHTDSLYQLASYMARSRCGYGFEYIERLMAEQVRCIESINLNAIKRKSANAEQMGRRSRD